MYAITAKAKIVYKVAIAAVDSSKKLSDIDLIFGSKFWSKNNKSIEDCT